MALVSHTYGKGRVRVMRIHRDGARHEPRELTIQAMLKGDFSRAFTDADNSNCISTDTVKNVVNVVARENLALDNEPFCVALAQKFFQEYPQVESVSINALETKWVRLPIDGVPHAHSFVLDNNGKNAVKVEATRQAVSIASGVAGFTFMKSTNSGWDNYVKDPYTTILETRDRMCATAMDATWRWQSRAGELSRCERQDHRDHAQGVRDHLQRERPGQPLPHGHGGAGGGAGTDRHLAGLPEQALFADQSFTI